MDVHIDVLHVSMINIICNNHYVPSVLIDLYNICKTVAKLHLWIFELCPDLVSTPAAFDWFFLRQLLEFCFEHFAYLNLAEYFAENDRVDIWLILQSELDF